MLLEITTHACLLLKTTDDWSAGPLARESIELRVDPRLEDAFGPKPSSARPWSRAEALRGLANAPDVMIADDGAPAPYTPKPATTHLPAHLLAF